MDGYLKMMGKKKTVFMWTGINMHLKRAQREKLMDFS